jgi:hypothetical protein
MGCANSVPDVDEDENERRIEIQPASSTAVMGSEINFQKSAFRSKANE